jgi:5-(carboxyamino)imidazole ribonucleotide synthase
MLFAGELDTHGRPTTLGVMGGGQLGRMFVQAAQRMGYATAVLDPDPTSPAGVVANYHVVADYLDEQGLAQLMQRSSAITTEFENIPSGALITLGSHRWVAPAGEMVAICQDRAAEKRQFILANVACAPHAVLEDAKAVMSLDASLLTTLLPGILKTKRLGYDGKGQRTVTSASELMPAFAELGHVPCVLERRLDLAFELSVVVARDGSGNLVHLPVQQNLHRGGVLVATQVPGPDVTAELERSALDATRRIAESMGYVGVLCVELFVLRDGSLVANEMAPRPHNSGHHSIDSCDVSQFDLQVRVLAGAPLTQPRQHSSAVMLNLMGDLWLNAEGKASVPNWAGVLALPGAQVHLYAKVQPRRGRKMGHLTVTAATPAGARQVALQAADLLGMQAV